MTGPILPSTSDRTPLLQHSSNETPLLVTARQPLHSSHTDVEDDVSPTFPRNKGFRPMLMRRGSSLIASFADERGSAESIRTGLATIFFGGLVLGWSMPKNLDLPTPWYRTVSSIIGYTYFLSWSVSFYPQVITNHKRKSTVGLSNDFTVINHIGYICYSFYTSSLFWDESIQDEYRSRHGDDAKITVQSNDVAFALHALILSFVWVVQIAYYGGFKTQILSKFFRWFLVGMLIACGGCVLVILLGINRTSWLDFMYLLSFVKVLITITKYVPQVLMNYRRRSTSGWTMWNVTLDVTGGLLSLLQLVLDSADMQDWSGLTGNMAKLGLSFVTIFFDGVFLLQHYVLYPPG